MAQHSIQATDNFQIYLAVVLDGQLTVKLYSGDNKIIMKINGLSSQTLLKFQQRKLLTLAVALDI